MTLNRTMHFGTSWGASGPAFPTLTNLIGRYMADTLVASPVTAVTNSANPGTNDLVNTGTVPWTATSAYHSKPAFQFTAANSANLHTSGSFPLSSGAAGSFFFVGQMTGSTAAYGRAMAYGAGALNDFNGAGCADFIGRDATNNGIAPFSAVFNAPAPGAFSISLNTNYRIGVVVDGSGSGFVDLYINNVSQGTHATVPGSFTNNGVFVIGNEYTSGAGTASPWDGPILEVVVCAAALTGTERNNLDTYFTDKYGS